LIPHPFYLLVLAMVQTLHGNHVKHSVGLFAFCYCRDYALFDYQISLM